MLEKTIQPQTNTIFYENFADNNDTLRRMELEGQCKIKTTKLLQFSCLKASLFFVPLILSIVGLFLIKYYKSLRAKIFYWQANRETATHIYIQGYNQRQEQIVPITSNGENIIFFYKKLKYELTQSKAVPVALNYQKQLSKRLDADYIKQGLSSSEVEQRKRMYGINEHIVDPPLYYEYLYEVMTEPFFFIQYLAAVIYIIQQLSELAMLLLGSSVLTTSINYILLYISYKKIKEMAEKVIPVEVLRNGEIEIIPSNQLVPGDIFVPKDELFCDVILLRGEMYVNESNLTGESIPIGKFALESFRHWVRNDNSKWIYEGSIVLSSTNPLAMVVNIGYSSKRGRILRKILNRPVTVSHLFTCCLYFLACTYVVGLVLYLATLPMRLNIGNLQGIIIFLNFLLVITQCFPPGCPIYFNLVYSFCLMRLKWNGILGTQPQKTVQSAHLKIMCFDKTGTLTEDKVQINRVIKFEQKQYRDITGKANEEKGLDFKIFGSCHTVRQFNHQLKGDEIDLKMFIHSAYVLKPPKQPKVCFDVQTKEGIKFNKISVLKLFQYESRFQSMSVLVYDLQTNKHYVFVKGAPEIIHRNSITKYDYFDQLLQNVSYGGYRCIAYGYKEIAANKVAMYLEETRQNYIKEINILGFLVFQNKLKGDSYETIKLLQESGITSRMITGDNIYIAIETAIRCGILSRNEEITVILGHQQQKDDKGYLLQHRKFNLTNLTFQNHLIKMEKTIVPYSEYLCINNSVVIDNDFLMMSHNIKLTEKIKVYARISPQNKALIVKRIKKDLSSTFRLKSRIEKIFSTEIDRVGMIGDGANDLLAIREADIGIGISNCDSSYAASFSVQTLKQIDYIVREAKCGEREIIEIVRFISITSFLSVPLLIIMETEGCYFNSFQLIVGNLSKYIILNILLALTLPTKERTTYEPCSNFMKKQNQIIYWGNVIIGALGHISLMLYYRSTPEYVWNYSKITIDSGWTYNTSLVSSQYFFYCVHPLALVFGLYVSGPWKQPIYKNYPLFIVLLANIAFTLLQFFIYPQISPFFGFASISYPCLGFLFLICIGDAALIVLFNIWANSLKLHESQFQDSRAQLNSLNGAQVLSTSQN